jgi:hypothetical protein
MAVEERLVEERLVENVVASDDWRQFMDLSRYKYLSWELLEQRYPPLPSS